jgi:hypothetical protein
VAKGVPAMSTPAIYQTDFPRLAATDSVDVALQRMLDDRISDLPVVDASGALVGMFKLEKLYAMLLPRGALLGHGMPDLTFASETLQQPPREECATSETTRCATMSSSGSCRSSRYVAARNRAAPPQRREQRAGRGQG